MGTTGQIDRAGMAPAEARHESRPAPGFAAALDQARRATTRDRGIAAETGAAAIAAPVARAGRSADVLFRDRIAALESSAGRGNTGYAARNPSSGALGRYQITPQALHDLGWQDAAGRWTATAARHGVASEAEFLANPAAQETAMAAFLRRAEIQLDRNGSLARAGGEVTGLDGNAVRLTEAGLVAAAHRRGAGSVARYLAHRADTPDAPLSAAERRAFASVEARLRGFEAVSYTLAMRRPATPSA